MNKKTILIAMLFVAFFAWFYDRFFNRPGFNTNKNQTQSLQLDWKELDEKSSEPKDPSTLKKNPPPKSREFETMSPSEEEQFALYDQMEQEWMERMKGLLSPEQFVLYTEMRERCEKEKAAAYKQYHDYLRKKHGDQFSYKISEDQSSAEKKINQKYLKELLKTVGEKQFSAYIKARDEINEKFRRQNKLFIQIEF